MTDISEGLAPRRAALELIAAAMSGRGGADAALTPALSGLEPRDRAFARSLALTTLRRWGLIEHVLSSRMHRTPPDGAMALLRIGVAQLLFMDIADHASVSTTLALADEAQTTKPYKALMNGVLRGLQREPPVLTVDKLTPDWLFARWRAAFGDAEAAAVSAMVSSEPATDLSVKNPADTERLAEALAATVLPGGTLRSSLRGDLAAWPDYEEGSWWVQDAAAAIPVRLLGLEPGQTVLDLCAAPGGKTMQLAATGAVVTAVDRSASRLKRLHENLARTGLTAEVVVTPAETWDDPRSFDAVLLDAPCSATGAFRRQPEVLWLVKPAEIAKLAMVQARMLDAAARRVRPGGRLVYSVCSLEPEEGEGQTAAFLRRHPDFSLDAIEPTEGGSPLRSLTPANTLRLLPHHMPGGMDGFFVARFKRNA